MSKFLCKLLGHAWRKATPSGPELCARCGARRRYRTNFRDRIEHKGGNSG